MVMPSKTRKRSGDVKESARGEVLVRYAMR